MKHVPQGIKVSSMDSSFHLRSKQHKLIDN